tara:strand:- start:9 stop:266 length:258 start_codon:yes stop_codon:yes gene_type:complete
MDIAKRTLTTTEESIFKDNQADVQTWVTNAINGKIYAVKKRMINHWTPILMADESVESIPANEDELIALIVARDDYTNRADRDKR